MKIMSPWLSVWMILGAVHIATADDQDKILIDAKRYTQVLFADEFKDAKLGSDWKSYKSHSMIRDGVLVGIEEPDGGHSSVNSVAVKPFGDVEVNLAFRFEGSKRFALAFNDSTFKGSHAGHICRVTFTPTSLTYQDGKTGVFNNAIYEKRKSGGKLDAETAALLKTKSAQFKMTFETGKWYTLSLRIQGDLMQAVIDGKPVGQFRSEGVAHATKNKPALVVGGQEMLIDHFEIKTP